MLRVGMMLFTLSLLSAGAAELRYAGRPVAEVLEEARSQGLGLIYNSQLVPRTLQVLKEPSASTARERVAEILKPHGLGLSAVADNLFAVVELPQEEPPVPPEPSTAAAQPAEEVVVTSSRYALATVDRSSHAVFNRDQVENLPRLGDEPLRVVQRLPGAAGNGLSGLARIRGGEENESQIVLNGLTLYEPFHLKNFFGPVSLMDARLLGRIDVYTGGFTVDYGDRMSAVIDAHTLSVPRQPYYELGISAFHTNALASGSVSGGKGSWLATLRGSNLDEVSKLGEQDYGKPDYFDGFGRLTYTLSPSTQVAFNVLASHDAVNVHTSDERERSVADYHNQYFWLELDHDFGAMHSRTVASATDVDNDRHGTVNDPLGMVGQVADRRDFQILGLQTEGEFNADEDARFKHRWGAELRALQAQYRYSSAVQFDNSYLLPLLSLEPPARSQSRDFDIEPQGRQYAAWWSTRIRLLSPLTAEVGLRWDAQTYSGPEMAEQFSPRLNLLYELDDDTRLRASWGRFFQPQGIHELQVEDGIAQFYPAQRSDHIILSVERRIAERTELRVEAYRKDYSRLRPRYENLFDPLVMLPELESDRIRVAPDAAHMKAVEFLLSHRGRGPWSAWMNYTYARAEDRFGGSDTPRSWDQRHAVQAGIDRNGVLWDFAVTGTWHSGWPTTVASVVGSGSAAQIQAGPRNAAQLGDFSSIDLRVSRRFSVPRGSLSVFAEATNALSRLNPCCTRYEPRLLPSGGIDLNADTRHWLPLVPSLGVLWTF